MSTTSISTPRGCGCAQGDQAACPIQAAALQAADAAGRKVSRPLPAAGILAAIPGPAFGPADAGAACLVVTLLDSATRPADLESGAAVDSLAAALGRWSDIPAGQWEPALRRECDRRLVAEYEHENDASQSDRSDDDLVAGLLTPGQPAALVGPEKCCKSLLAADLVAAGLTRTPFLGFTIRDRFKAAVLSFEGRPGDFRRSVARSLIRRGLSRPAAELESGRFLVADDRRLLLKRREREEFESYLRRAGVRLVVVDCLYQAMPATATTSVFAMGRALRNLLRPIAAAGATPLVIHHTRELAIGEPPTLNDVSGVGLSAFAKGWLLLNRAEAYDGSGTHRLIGVSGTSQGAFARLALELDERSMSVRTSAPPASAVTPERATGGRRRVPPFLAAGK